MSSSIERIEMVQPVASKNVTPREFILTDISTVEIEVEAVPEQLGEDEVMYPDGGRQAWIVIVGCFAGLMAGFGLANSMSAIEAYVASHQLEEFSTLSVSWIFSVYIGLSYMCSIFSGVLFDEIGARLPLTIGTCLVFVGILATANCSEPYQFILAFGVMTGSGTALCMNPLIGVISHWFMKKRGIAIGIATVGGSVGGIVFPLMLSNLYEKVGYAWLMRILALIMLVLLVCALLLVKERPELRKALQERAVERDGDELPIVKKELLFYLKNVVDFSAFKETKFSVCVVAATFLEVALVSSMTFFASYALSVAKTSENVAFNLVAIINATSILGRCVPNYLSDRYGVFNAFILMSMSCVILQFIMWLTFGDSLTVLYAFAVCYGFFSASILSLIPVACAAVSPTKHFGKRYATMCLFLGVGCLVGIPIGGTIIGDGAKHNFDNFIIYISVMTTMGMIFLVATRFLVVGNKLKVKV